MRNSMPAGAVRSLYYRGAALTLLAGVMWSTMGLGVRFIEHAQAFQILLYRSFGLIVVLVLFLTVRSGGRPWRVIARAGAPSILGGLVLSLAFVGSIVSLTQTTVANAVFLLATAPLFAAILGRIVLGEPVRTVTWAMMAVGGVGVALMVIEGISLGRMLGNVAAVACAVCFALFTIALRSERSGDTLPAVLFAAVYSIAASTAAIVVAGDALVLTPRDAAISVALGIFSLGAGLICYTLGSRHIAAGEAALLAMTEVVLSPVWVWLILNESGGFFTLVGGVLLLGALAGNAVSGILAQRRSERHAAEAAAALAPISRPVDHGPVARPGLLTAASPPARLQPVGQLPRGRARP